MKQRKIIDQIGIQHYDKIIEYKQNDLSKLVYALAVFYPKENEIFRLSAIDYRAARFDVSTEKMTRWITFPNAELFVFTHEETFNHYYELYEKGRIEAKKPVKSKEQIWKWLSRDTSRVGIQDEKNDDEK